MDNFFHLLQKPRESSVSPPIVGHEPYDDNTENSVSSDESFKGKCSMKSLIRILRIC